VCNRTAHPRSTSTSTSSSRFRATTHSTDYRLLLLLFTQSAAVADVLYDMEWYKCDARTRKVILMILRRSQRAKTIAVPFFTPSLPALRSVWDAMRCVDYDNKCLCFCFRFRFHFDHLPGTPDTQHSRLIYHAAKDVPVSPRGV